MLNLYIIDKNNLGANEIPIQFINKSRLQESTKYHYEDDRVRSLFGWLLLRYAAKHSFRIEADSQEILFNLHNKPSFKNSECKFNISHSKNLVIVGISETDLGVDIEHIDLTRSLSSSLLNRVLDEDKDDIFMRDGEQLSAFFYKRWTQLESFMKYKGIGLVAYPATLPLNTISIQSFLILDTLENEYYISVATKEKQDLNVYYLSIDELFEGLTPSIN